jgi:hypothetical protein
MSTDLRMTLEKITQYVGKKCGGDITEELKNCQLTAPPQHMTIKKLSVDCSPSAHD